MSGDTRTRAIVLNNRKFGESDLIVTFMTPGHGLVSGLARGALKSRKRFAGCFEPFTLIELGCRLKGGRLARIDTADIARPHYGIREDLDRIRSASCVVELAGLVEPPEQEREEAFRMVAWALAAIEGSSRPIELLAVFLVRYLAVAGFGVSTDTCSECGGPISKDGAGYLGGEGLVCAHCAGPVATLLSRGLTAFIKRARSVEESRADRLRISPAALGEFMRFMKEYLGAVSGREPRSFKSLDPASFA